MMHRRFGIRDVRIHDILPERAAALAEALRDRDGISARVCATAREAVDNADIVSLTTNAKAPVTRYDWLAPGTHVAALGAHNPKAREVDSDTVAAARVFAESRESLLSEAGDFLIPLGEGRFDESHLVAEIGAVASGAASGRRDATDLTLFKSTGMGLQDLAAAALVYERALATGIGRRLEI